jgi:hypothetical protein
MFTVKCGPNTTYTINSDRIVKFNEVTMSQTICPAAGQCFEKTKCPAVVVTIVQYKNFCLH